MTTLLAKKLGRDEPRVTNAKPSLQPPRADVRTDKAEAPLPYYEATGGSEPAAGVWGY